MKSLVQISFEHPYDDEAIEMYNALSEEKVQELLEMWKVETEKIIRQEISEDIENVRVIIELIR